MPLVTGAIILGGSALAGGVLSGIGTAQSQSKANDAAAQNAALQTMQSFYNYLAQKGVNIQSLIAANPGYQASYQDAAKGAYKGKSFEQWFYDHIKAAGASDPIWQQINNPSAANSQNTTLPSYVQINGQQAQPALAQQLTDIFSKSQAAKQASVPTVGDFLAANPETRQTIEGEIARLKSINDPGGDRTPEQWLTDTLADEKAAGGGGWTTGFEKYSADKQAADLAANGPAPATTLPQQAGQDSATTIINDLLAGKTLDSNLTALQPALDARTNTAALQQQLLDEQRAANTNIRDVQLTGLQDLLGTRETGANSIYNTLFDNAGNLKSAQELAASGVNDATLKGLADVLGVRTTAANDIYGAQKTGANDIYGAQLLGADTYGQSGKEAVDRVLQQQAAQRARQGFVGTSSGADLTSGRIIAPLLQQGALARTQAGVDLQRALATAGIGLQTNLGGAREQNSLGQLQSGVTLAQALGNAGVGYAGNVGNAALTQQQLLAQAREQAASGRLGANTQLATSNAGLLDTNAEIAKQNAAFQNAMDKLNLTISGQGTQLGAIGAPAALAGSQTTLQNNQNAQQYGDIMALLQALSAFNIGQVQQPVVTTSNPQPVVNGLQIAGGAVQSLGSSLANLMALSGGGAGGGGTGTSGGSSGSGFNFSSGSPSLLTQSTGTYNPGFAQTPIFSVPSGTGTACWVAREAFGWTNPKWLQFRQWLLTKATDDFRSFYLKFGPAIAERIRGDESAKALIRDRFDAILAAA